MRIRSDDFADMQPIAEEFAFGKPGPNGEPCVFAPNRNPHLAWSEVPEGTRSFVLICVDTDVPTSGEDVNQEGRHVPASLPRQEFFHWVMTDIPAECRELGSGSCAEGVVAHGKPRSVRTARREARHQRFHRLVCRRQGHVRQLLRLRRAVSAVERRPDPSLSFPRVRDRCRHDSACRALHGRRRARRDGRAIFSARPSSPAPTR